MTLLAPGWLLLAAGAALGVVAIHLIAWRLPRAVVLPTARFVPNEPARLAARAIRPSDLALLALRVAIIMAGGLALARPIVNVAPAGSATVIAIDKTIGDTLAIRDSLRAIPRADAMSFVVFDTTTQVVSDEAGALNAVAERSITASLTVGLIAAIREARRLRRDYESVGIVLVSSFSSGQFDRASERVRATWPDSIRVVRIPAPARATEAARVEFDGTGDDPVVAGVRLAASHGLLKGTSRVVRGTPTAADSALASAGQALVLWPRQRDTSGDRVDGIHAGDATAIGYFVRTPAGTDSGRVIARWVDGAPAARETPLGDGCVRTVAFDVADPGDFVLTTSFQRLASVLVSSCGRAYNSETVADSVIAGIGDPPADQRAAIVPDESRGPNRVAALLMVIAILMAIAELAVRRGIRQAPAEQGV